MTMTRNVCRNTAIEELRGIVIHLLEKPIRVEVFHLATLLRALPFPVQSIYAVLQKLIQAMNDINHPQEPSIPVMRRRMIDCRIAGVGIQLGQLQRDERVQDEVPSAERMEATDRLNLTICKVDERDVGHLIVGDEGVEADVVRTDENVDHELRRVEEKLAGVADVVLDEPVYLATRNVRIFASIHKRVSVQNGFNTLIENNSKLTRSWNTRLHRPHNSRS
jgi:hypothetical protein